LAEQRPRLETENSGERDHSPNEQSFASGPSAHCPNDYGAYEHEAAPSYSEPEKNSGNHRLRPPYAKHTRQ